jgi:hypothetical protein
MIPGPSVERVRGRIESNGSERHAPGSPARPLSAARSDRSDRDPARDGRSDPSNPGEGLPDRGADRSPNEDRPPDEDRLPDETEGPVDEIERLEAEIERKDRHLRYVIDRYERLLAEKNRQLDEERSEPTDGVWPAVRSAVARLLPGDR